MADSGLSALKAAKIMDNKITVLEFFEENKVKLQLKILAGETCLKTNTIIVSDINRPGLALAGYYDYFPFERLQVFGKTEMSYLAKLGHEKAHKVIENIFKRKICCAVITWDFKTPHDFLGLAKKYKIPVLTSSMHTTKFVSAAMIYLERKFAPKITMHGTFIDVYGIGVMVIGRSGIGKSEIALELVKRGHRLVADDIVKITKHADGVLVGKGPSLVQHHMEIRGVGILDIKKLFGIGAIRDEQEIQLIIRLESWEKGKDYERIGLDQRYEEMLGIKVPTNILPVISGRNLSVIVEAAAMNQRLKNQGYDAVAELDRKITKQIETAKEKKNAASR